MILFEIIIQNTPNHLNYRVFKKKLTFAEFTVLILSMLTIISTVTDFTGRYTQ